jgi:hypothetical protein
LADTEVELPEQLPEGEEGKKEYSRAATRARAAQERATKAEAELAALKTEQRTAQLKAVLPPGIDPSIYPADAPTGEGDIQAFLRDKLGLTPEASAAWGRYEQATGQAETPGAPKDEDAAWSESEQAKTAAFYQRQNAPTAQEVKDMEELKAKVFGRLNEWDQRVSEGRMDVLIEPGGFGGLTDPPPWARRARHSMTSGR